MKRITQSQLIALLDAFKGMLPLGVETETAPSKMRVKNNPNRDALKRCKGNLTTGCNYGNAVLREGDRQGVKSDFKAGPLPRKDDAWLIVNKVIYNPRLRQFYLRTESTPGQREASQMRLVGYFTPSGSPIPADEIKPFLPQSKESQKQQESGLNETVWVRDWKLESLKSVTIAGVKYQISQGDDTQSELVKLKSLNDASSTKVLAKEMAPA